MLDKKKMGLRLLGLCIVALATKELMRQVEGDKQHAIWRSAFGE